MVGLGAIFVVCLIIAVIWHGRHLPGFVGEWFATVLGIITTPFLMEASFIALGLLIVMIINHWRMRREGDELVYLDQAEGPGSELLPESARWAVYEGDAPASDSPDLLTRLEGAMEIGDHDSAVELLGEMDESERSSAAVLELRLRLARETGKTELAERLRAMLDQSGH